MSGNNKRRLPANFSRKSDSGVGQNKRQEEGSPFKKFEKKKTLRTPKNDDSYSHNRNHIDRGQKTFEHKSFKKRHFEKKEEAPRIEPGQENSKHRSDGLIRLNKYIADAGICARRQADELIEMGVVEVDGKIVTALGTRVSRSSKVKVKGEPISPEKKVYVLMNKPKGHVTTLEDPHADRTVMDILKNHVEERIYPVGRLDKDTVGVLLLTNDGDITERLTHPSSDVKKLYHVFLDKALTKNDMMALADGVELEDGMAAVDSAAYASEDKTEVGVELHSGRNRIVRRMFEHLGYKVKKLDRVSFAGFTKKNVPRGHWRFLTDKEISFLKMHSKKKGK
ncbi:MAG: pseudouridine synthase [Bacteroidales bacterium]